VPCCEAWQLATAKGVPSPVTFGKHYYDRLRSEYASDQCPLGVLQGSGGGQPVRAELFQAMLAAKRSHKPSREPLVEFMRSGVADLNTTECTGLFKWVLSLRWKCARQLPHCVDALRCFRRNEVHTKYADKFDPIKGWCDSVLREMLARHELQKGVQKAWIEANCSLLELIISGVVLARWMKAGDYPEKQTYLLTIAVAGETGK
jgi:hypothetical protein